MKLHYQQSGEGKPLIIIHGLFGSSDNWKAISNRLSSVHNVISVDLRNHGRSPHASDQSYSAMANDIAELAEELKLSEMDVLGHSIGGKTAIALAAEYPALINKLMVIDIAPRAYEDRHSEIFKALLAINLSQYSKRSEVDAVLAKDIADMAVRQFLLMNLNISEQGLSWRNNLKAQYANYQQLLESVALGKQIAIPSCFIRGGLSDYITDEDCASIKQQFTDCQIETVSGVGHWVHAEAPDLFINLAQSFFAYD